MAHFEGTNSITQTASPDSFITLYCSFQYGDANVSVSNPIVTFYNSSSTDITSDITIIKYLSKVSESGYIYSINFIPSGLTSGRYTVKFEGDYGTEHLIKEGSFELAEIPILQHYIFRLRNLLWDMYIEDYNLDPSELKWNDGQLYDFIINAVDAVNVVYPPTSYDFTGCIRNGLGWSLLKRAQYEALFSRYILEIARDFNYSDGLSLQFERATKYADASKAILDEWEKEVHLKKTRDNLHNGWRAVVDYPIPLTLSYMLSFNPTYGNYFGLTGYYY